MAKQGMLMRPQGLRPEERAPLLLATSLFYVLIRWKQKTCNFNLDMHKAF